MGDLSALKTSLTVKVNNRLIISKAFEMDIEAFGTIEKTVDDSVSPIIGLQPLDAGAVRLLMIAADSYPGGIAYEAVTAAGGPISPDAGEKYELDQLHLYIGSTVTAVHDKPKHLKFTNTSGEAVKIEIFVARSATNA